MAMLQTYGQDPLNLAISLLMSFAADDLPIRWNRTLGHQDTNLGFAEDDLLDGAPQLWIGVEKGPR